jgi:hypothetical protein
MIRKPGLRRRCDLGEMIRNLRLRHGFRQRQCQVLTFFT